jgi:hypothetical protein
VHFSAVAHVRLLQYYCCRFCSIPCLNYLLNLNLGMA